MIKKILLVISSLLFGAAVSASNSSDWSKIQGGKVVDGKYQIKCGEGTGWQKCGEEESDLFLVVNSYAHTGLMGYVVQGSIPNPPLDQVIYCEKEALSIIAAMHIEDIPYSHENYIEFTKKGGFPELEHGFCPPDPFSLQAFSMSEEVDGIHELTVANAINPIPVDTHFNTNAPAVPNGTLVCAQRDLYTSSFHKYNGSVYKQADRHYLCSKTLLSGVSIPLVPNPMSTSHKYSNYLYGARGRSPRLKDHVKYVKSSKFANTRYAVGEIVYLQNRPDHDSGMSLFDNYMTVYRVTKEKY